MLYSTDAAVTLLQFDTRPKQPSMSAMKRFQELLAPMPQVQMEPRHYFADGMYGRVLPIPADTVVVGKIHRHEHLVALIKGEATINTDRGMERIRAPHVWISKPGAKRALVTHTDCEFMTTHLNPDNTRDLDALEADIIVPEALGYETPSLADDIQAVYA